MLECGLYTSLYSKLNFSKFDSSNDEDNDENNDENQTSEESTSTEGTFNTIERIYDLTLDSVFANYRHIVRNSINGTLIFGGLIDMID